MRVETSSRTPGRIPAEGKVWACNAFWRERYSSRGIGSCAQSWKTLVA
jgi:hypothetical protein